MKLPVFEKLHSEGLVGDQSWEKVKKLEEKRLFSLHWELKTLLYLGVLLLSSGLGVLIYKNIETIGHRVVLFFIALIFCGCFFYCVRQKLPFSIEKVPAPNPFFDYILLLGCLSFVSFIAYLQFQYGTFGHAYGLATFIPMIVLLFSAYYFDHIGILSLAITNLAAWLGIAVTPMRILADNDFWNERLIYTGILLGLALILTGVLSQARNFKKHFEFTYLNFGVHLFFISSLAGLFSQRFYGLWFLWIAGIAGLFYRQSLKRQSFYFLVCIFLYAYIAFSYAITRLAIFDSGEGGATLISLYFIFSGVGMVYLFIHLNRKRRSHDRL